MPSRFAAVTNKEISLLIKQAVPEIHEEGEGEGEFPHKGSTNAFKSCICRQEKATTASVQSLCAKIVIAGNSK